MTSLNKIIYTERFVKDAKSFVKKHRTFRQTLEELEKQLIENPRSGDPYGSKIYKVRISDQSKGKGKSGGFRVITYVVDENKQGTNIYLVTIFDKSEEASIKKEDAIRMLKQCGLL